MSPEKSTEPVNNTTEFTDDFFNAFRPMLRIVPVDMGDVTREYTFPVFYKDVTKAVAAFFCNYDATLSLVKDELNPGASPLNMGRNRALVLFSCYENTRVLNMEGYDEIAISIPVVMNPAVNLPVLPMITKSKKFGYHVSRMFSSSEEDTRRTRSVWKFNKLTTRIDVSRSGNTFCSSATDPEGELIVRVKIPMKGTIRKMDDSSVLFSGGDGRLEKCVTHFRGNFRANRFMSPMIRKYAPPTDTFLEIGPSPMAEFLKALSIEEQPLELIFSENVKSCLTLPQVKRGIRAQ